MSNLTPTEKEFIETVRQELRAVEELTKALIQLIIKIEEKYKKEEKNE